ncbi:MAG: BMP family ABC transporter substrate-binding protein [Christensenellales bacterium]|uniref:BMP family ABC transporter substrate-binding protein n=1 Tax=Candidatus Avichristensenella intestinipullorum TaxID=2840693 RepID=A0A9D0YWE3_9FIRM|nr:BMP family ABC transporter substrate-binding protein [Christensenellales bacterium]HIQ63461.1 BMP family ABC transporter substrate-binding protein [Candidatus Avichristensenella intestinipullorum]
MKKLLALVLSVALALGVAPFAFAEGETFELALVTDIGTIDDKSFNQGAWEGLVQYAEENNLSHKYYQPLEKSTDAYLDQIELAVNAGAKVIVTPGFLFEEPIYIAQDMYPDVHFILLDGEPHNADYSEYRTNENVAAILYAEDQSGFLAGYAVVKGGYTNLGFMGGMAVPAVIRFGYGFLQGAEYAAKEMGIEEITVNYHYTGSFDATPEAQTLASGWYNDGVEVIFGCGGSVGNSVMAAAEAMENKWVVGVDKDQSVESETVITSATKGLAASVYQTLQQFYAGEFPGAQTTVKDASNEGVALPMETTKIEGFTQEDYDALYALLANGEITLLKDTDATSAAELPLEIVKVTVIE